jgi:cytochrome oxidase Cu insertion factor (SCO1/SenC/PrrC family)
MNKKTLFIPVVLILAVCVIILTNMQAAPDVTPGQVYEITEVKLASKDKMTDFVFTDHQGKERTLKELVLGKYVFLNF